MLGGYIPQGILQSNQQKTIQVIPNKKELKQVHKSPKDEIDIGMVEGDEELFSLKKFSSDIKNNFLDESKDDKKLENLLQGQRGKAEKSKKELKHNSGENPLRRLENFGGLICEEAEGSLKVTIASGKAREGELTPRFLTGNSGETPSAQAAILTAQTIVEKGLTEKDKGKYTRLKGCPLSSKIIPGIEKCSNTFADIVVKNEPLLVEG